MENIKWEVKEFIGNSYLDLQEQILRIKNDNPQLKDSNIILDTETESSSINIRFCRPMTEKEIQEQRDTAKKAQEWEVSYMKSLANKYGYKVSDK